jgi:demethylmenaquinone methyltransferase/2-methoxy-6-polyprenyl-1,4-benzoquinol methylase
MEAPMGHRRGSLIAVGATAGFIGWAARRASLGDVRDFDVPAGTTAVLASFSLEMVPEHDAVIGAAAERLSSTGGRIAVLVPRPDTWPTWVITVARIATSVFGVTRGYEQITPWHSVGRHFEQIHWETALGGAMYLVAGAAQPGTSRPAPARAEARGRSGPHPRERPHT